MVDVLRQDQINANAGHCCLIISRIIDVAVGLLFNVKIKRIKMIQQTFEDYLARKPDFDGSDYDRDRDQGRLTGQIKRVHAAMIDGKWKTLSQIADLTGDPEASISAQLRHLRKPKFGAYTIEKKHLGNGLYEYRML